ncbi:MAG: hypothetical protein A2Y62_20810 [Candidatus Fischerbacteria bacterium RBG_13_37_8]|uniref:Fibronectin type-III domain-containing protein n=1 Tax=Candidatus Fischerbacteria bacterium RBG_13_37_8 TaxID=1817863 RepID=A0A1F5VEW9_9BACT|nr:MAG: hypothetical protein A2Y62_20810 [Candidatus Fischerbacteria bacterium RBG_13_37_8]
MQKIFNAVDNDGCADTGVTVTRAVDPADWGDNGYGNRYYEILRDGSTICTTPPSPDCGTDNTGNNGQIYTYTLRYVNGCGLSAETAGADAMDWVDVTPCPSLGNTLLVAKSGGNAVISWTAVSCPDLSNYRVHGSISYDASFPSAWMPLGSPTSTSFNDVLTSTYIAYKTIAVDYCCNDSL